MVTPEVEPTPAVRVGDRVALSIGGEVTIATALEVYGPPSARMVLVEIPVHGSTGEKLTSRETSFPLAWVRPLLSLSTEELGGLLRRFRPVASAVRPGQSPPVWIWEPYLEVHAELERRGVTEDEIDRLAWDRTLDE